MSVPSQPRVVATVHQAEDLQAIASLKLDALCDLLEFRLDSLAAQSAVVVAPLMRTLAVPSIITARHPEEGGAGNLTEAARCSLLMESLSAAAAVDVELRSARSLSEPLASARAAKKLVILSFHDFDATPASAALREMVSRAIDAGADIAKIATRLHGNDDLFRLAQLVESENRIPISAMGMGDLGMVSRLLLARCGSVLNYGYLSTPNAPGQWRASDLRAILRENV